MLSGSDDFMRLRKRYEPSYQLPSYPQADIQSLGATALPDSESPVFTLGQFLLWFGVLLMVGGAAAAAHTIYRKMSGKASDNTHLKNPSCAGERPFDPYLACTNTSLDASIIAANEPSFKHTTIPPRAYCASSRRPDPTSGGGEAFQWQFHTAPPSCKIVSCSSTGFGPNMIYYPNVIWDTPSAYSTSTPNGSWKNVQEKDKDKRMSSPPAYQFGEGFSVIEKKGSSNDFLDDFSFDLAGSGTIFCMHHDTHFYTYISTVL
ncbi:hypothetical protein NP233_g3696 [Leucocoprinus birnbaumii]|uniref:Uncharacterized protein n=1 Tax=Leucocoprinus birnbaumii TaxID=56174 RepID=A0AAD5VW24_9AGAR|nr:hypothetical protein NP233_g3696 [Leucocoprinus birnbaumii]